MGCTILMTKFPYCLFPYRLLLPFCSYSILPVFSSAKSHIVYFPYCLFPHCLIPILHAARGRTACSKIACPKPPGTLLPVHTAFFPSTFCPRMPVPYCLFNFTCPVLLVLYCMSHTKYLSFSACLILSVPNYVTFVLTGPVFPFALCLSCIKPVPS
jgi:hypothetical protein